MAAKKKRTVARPQKDVGPLTLAAVEIAGWPPVGASVHLSVAPHRTVLVGKNGAGKSLILEALHEARLRILKNDYRHGPTDFRCSFAGSDGQLINYRYVASGSASPDSSAEDIEGGLEAISSWEECCWAESSSNPIWKVANGRVSTSEGSEFLVPPGTSLLALPSTYESELPDECISLRNFFKRQRLVRAGLLREAQHREVILIPDKEGGYWSSLPGHQQRIERLAAELIGWSKKHPSHLDEFVQIGRRLEVWKDVEIAEYTKHGGRPRKPEIDSLISVNFDDTNIGLISDGTLRIAATLAALFSAREGGMLLLEEPETGIHPGLLSRLLSTLESYAVGQQILISTHSHQVVNWVSPNDVRLVERRNGATRVSSLSDEQVQRLVPYLEEEGTLGDFLYGGGADA